MSQPVFRFAPSPNGRLHLGHAYSALLNEKMARGAGGRLLLRIEDTDRTRCTAEHTRHVLEDLKWLGVEWEEPVRIQSQHFALYRANVEQLWKMGVAYPCFCSRKTAAQGALSGVDPEGQPLYGGTCRSVSVHEATARIGRGDTHAWRLNVEACQDAEASVWGDAVIAKFGIGSSYHIAVVTDDALQGVTHVVRGMDMLAATPIHLLLQRLLGFASPHYHHHELIVDETGAKLSKSLKSQALAAWRERGVSAEEIRRQLGFGEDQKSEAMPFTSQSP